MNLFLLFVTLCPIKLTTPQKVSIVKIDAAFGENIKNPCAIKPTENEIHIEIKITITKSANNFKTSLVIFKFSFHRNNLAKRIIDIKTGFC